jgi:hypothetical protein
LTNHGREILLADRAEWEAAYLRKPPPPRIRAFELLGYGAELTGQDGDHEAAAATPERRSQIAAERDRVNGFT